LSCAQGFGAEERCEQLVELGEVARVCNQDDGLDDELWAVAAGAERCVELRNA